MKRSLAILGFCVFLSLCTNYVRADILPPRTPGLPVLENPRPTTPQEPTRAKKPEALIKNTSFKIERGTTGQTILYVPTKYAAQFRGNAAPVRNRTSSSRGQLPTIIAGIALSLAIVSAGIILMRLRRFSYAPAAILVGAIAIGSSVYVYANAPPVFLPNDVPTPLATPPTVANLPVNLGAGKMDVVVSAQHQHITIVLGKDVQFANEKKR